MGLAKQHFKKGRETMPEQVQINEKQRDNLKAIIKAKKIDYNSPDLDRRSIRALVARELVKLVDQKTGTFVIPTAKGKKLN